MCVCVCVCVCVRTEGFLLSLPCSILPPPRTTLVSSDSSQGMVAPRQDMTETCLSRSVSGGGVPGLAGSGLHMNSLVGRAWRLRWDGFFKSAHRPRWRNTYIQRRGLESRRGQMPASR